MKSYLCYVIAFSKFSVPPVTEGARVFDETGTEVDVEVFEEIAQQPNVGILTIKFDNGIFSLFIDSIFIFFFFFEQHSLNVDLSCTLLLKKTVVLFLSCLCLSNFT